MAKKWLILFNSLPENLRNQLSCRFRIYKALLSLWPIWAFVVQMANKGPALRLFCAKFEMEYV